MKKDTNNVCILTGKEITSYEEYPNPADGVRTNLGPVHREAYERYKTIIAQSIAEVLGQNPGLLRNELRDRQIRKRARKIIEASRAKFEVTIEEIQV